jgi:hypothetical protein
LLLLSGNHLQATIERSELFRSERVVDVMISGQDRLPWDRETVKVEVTVLDRDKGWDRVHRDDVLRDNSLGDPPLSFAGGGGGPLLPLPSFLGVPPIEGNLVGSV